MNRASRDVFTASFQSKLDRRRLLRQTGAAGLGAAMLAAGSPAVLAQDAANPLGVDGSKPLDFLMWKAGWGDEYALNALELYKGAFPDAEIKYEAVQRVLEAAQPRFVAGDPPDVVESSALDRTSLVANQQLAPLTDLLAAPSFDIEGKTVGETLLPGTQDTLVYEGVPYGINFTAGMYGIWYSAPLMEEHGWTYPQTWEEMLALCEEIKSAGVAPFTYPGQYPSYFSTPFWQFVWKDAGLDPIIAIDNLQPDAWRHDSVRAGLDALYQLRQRGYMLEGSEALSHTESQAEWLQGKAVFIPNGNWLENEMKDLIPDGFDMVVSPTPPLTEGGPVGFEGIQTYSGQPFTVPAQAKNPEGGMEMIRMIISKQNARYFSEYAQALTTVTGAADGLDLSTAFNSAKEVTEAAGDQVLAPPLYGTWYKALGEEVTVQMGALLGGQIDPDGFIDAIQQAFDDVANDDSIPKFTREA
ncbi:MAG TPA: N-acetylglucosamine/diacetylchitobiose ABC transporter substrate-binding protein [Thermomicrobiales bacterium]|nr:N-acetylglucosamine/diacetylchitobiose ABC transporter substrate-binding protein [Thermomicrobiales bacterium]